MQMEPDGGNGGIAVMQRDLTAAARTLTDRRSAGAAAASGALKVAALACLIALLLSGCAGSKSDSGQGAGGTTATASGTTATASGTTATPDSRGPEGLIAFAAKGDIYVIRPSGDGLRRVTRGPDDDFSPSWFPDGRHLAFRRAAAGSDLGKTSIYQAAIDGTGIRKADLPQDAEDLTWSPDGTKIAYSGGLPGEYSKGDILIAAADGSNPRLGAGWVDSTDEFLSWSPDGTEIVFASNHGLPSDEVRTLWIASLADGKTRPLTQIQESPYLSTDVHPGWSPDGETILFQSNRGTGDSRGVAVWLIDRDGTNLRRLPGGSGEFPSWSPDGSQIAFGTMTGITITDADGANARTIADPLGYTAFPNWSTFAHR